MTKNIDRYLEEFEEKFCNNHQKPIRFLRSVFYDEQDGAEQIEQFIKEALSSAIKEHDKEIMDKIEEIMFKINATSTHNLNVLSKLKGKIRSLLEE